MSSAIRSRSRAACVEDVDEDTGSVLEGTAKYATSQPPSPRKEQSNIGKSRKSDGSRRGRSPTRDEEASSRFKTRPVGSKLEKPRGPPLQIRPVHARHRTTTAPHIVHSATSHPNRQEEAEYYGISSSTHSDSHPPPRPRAHTAAMPRPPSFHSGEPPRGGLPYGRYPGGPPPGPPGPPGPLGPPGANIPTSFPPPSWYQGPPPSRLMPPQLGAPPSRSPRTPLEGPPNGFPFPPNPPFGHPNGPMPGRSRPHSSMGHRQQQPSYDFAATFEHDDVDGGPPPPPPAPASVARRPSVTQAQRRVRDRQSMPPPPSHPQMRPQSARPANAVMFRPPPETPSMRSSSNRKVNFDQTDDESDVEYLGAHEAAVEYNIPESRYLPAPPPRSVATRSHGRRQSVNERVASYSQPAYRTEVARSRRHSVYGTSFDSSVPEDSGESSSDDLEEKIKNIQLYTGAPAAPPPPRQRLTQGALRHVSQRGGGSSRSTGSSDSFDESEMPSHTTRTSHSNGDENGISGVKIRGAKRINVGGVDVELGGGEVEIQASRNDHKGSFREETGTVYRENRRLRYEPTARPPMSNGRPEGFSRSRTAQPQLASAYAPPPSQYSGYPTQSPLGYPSPTGPYRELEWRPQQQWNAYESPYYH